MTRPQHKVVRHATQLTSVEAVTLATFHRFPRHSHDDFGLGLVDKGGHRSWSGRGFVEALPGDLITVNPGEMHDGAPIDGVTRTWRMIYVLPRAMSSVVEGDQNRTFEFARPAFHDSRARRLFISLFEALTQPSPDQLLQEERLAALLLAMTSRWSASEQRGRIEAPPPIARALQAIDDDPTAKMSLAQLASIAGVSRFQLLRSFARHTGATPHAYRTQSRARRARALLLQGMTPAEAAFAAGFADQSHLTRVLQRQFCITPSAVRSLP